MTTGQGSTAFNAGKFDSVASLYNPGAQLIAPESTDFMTQPSLAAFCEKSHASGIKDVHLATVHTLQESERLIHEIGHLYSATGSHAYYVRWVKPADEWQLAFDIMSVGS